MVLTHKYEYHLFLQRNKQKHLKTTRSLLPPSPLSRFSVLSAGRTCASYRSASLSGGSDSSRTSRSSPSAGRGRRPHTSSSSSSGGPRARASGRRARPAGARSGCSRDVAGTSLPCPTPSHGRAGRGCLLSPRTAEDHRWHPGAGAQVEPWA